MSTSPSPRDLTTGAQRREELVSQVLDSLETIEELSTEQQLAILGEAQAVLTGVLNNDADLSQLSIPGVATRP